MPYLCCFNGWKRGGGSSNSEVEKLNKEVDYLDRMCDDFKAFDELAIELENHLLVLKEVMVKTVESRGTLSDEEKAYHAKVRVLEKLYNEKLDALRRSYEEVDEMMDSIDKEQS